MSSDSLRVWGEGGAGVKGCRMSDLGSDTARGAVLVSRLAPIANSKSQLKHGGVQSLRCESKAGMKF